MAAGAISAHWLAYTLAVPDVSARRTLLAATGHARGVWLLGLVGCLAAIALATGAAALVRRGSLLDRVRLRPGWFLVLPPIAFAVQEELERAAVGYGTPLHVWLEPTFWRGLALQLPFGAIAFLIASLLLRVAVAVERIVERRRDPLLRPVVAATIRSCTAPGSRVLRLVRGGDALRFRGPPAVVRGCP